MTPRTLVITTRVLRQLRKDKNTLIMIVLQPIIIIGIFGFAFGGDVEDARVAVADLDRGSFGSKVLDALDEEVVEVVRVESGVAARQALLERRVLMAVVIPANFTRDLESARTGEPETARIYVYKDNTNPQVTGEALAAFADAFADALEDETNAGPAFDFEEEVVFGPDEESFLDFFVPGVAAFSIFQLGMLLTAVTIVKEKTLGTLPRLLASPIRRWEVVLGYTAGFTMLSLVQAAAILAVTTLVFRVEVQGSILLALFVTTLVGIVALAFGIFISGIAKSEFQAVQSIFIFSFPNLFLAGIFSPLEAMPPLVRPISNVVPLTYAVDALRGTLNYGQPLTAILPEILILAAFAFGFLLVAAFSFGRKA